MALKLNVFAAADALETKWAADLRECLKGRFEVEVQGRESEGSLGEVVFLDQNLPDLRERLQKIDRRGKAVFLIADERAGVPPSLLDGSVDDVLVHPFRPLEALSKLRHFQQILMWDEVNSLNASFAEALESLREDLRLAESLQKRRLPLRFPGVKGFKVTSRYIAGMRSGGDHFDLADSKDGHSLSIVLSDSSSYGLSSAVLSALMRVTVKLSADQARSAPETLRAICGELASTLKEKDRLSLLYAVVSRRDYTLKYVGLGSGALYYAPAGRAFQHLPTQGEPVRKDLVLDPLMAENQIQLEPSGRIAVLSDGFAEIIGGEEKVLGLLNGFREKEAADALNELIFNVKSKYKDEDDLPAQDCTAVILDVDSKISRLSLV